MRENKRKHLEFIQGVVNRLSTNSFLLKGWSVGLVAALFALAAKDADTRFLLLVFVPITIFWGLDGYCLWQERLYRALYRHVRLLPEEQADFCMSTEKVKGEKGLTWWSATFSKTVLLFHGALVFSALIVTYALR
ncbi:MAG: hypothetical protein ACKO0Z_22460 [Betaproteobacteria bacterium]